MIEPIFSIATLAGSVIGSTAKAVSGIVFKQVIAPLLEHIQHHKGDDIEKALIKVHKLTLKDIALACERISQDKDQKSYAKRLLVFSDQDLKPNKSNTIPSKITTILGGPVEGHEISYEELIITIIQEIIEHYERLIGKPMPQEFKQVFFDGTQKVASWDNCFRHYLSQELKSEGGKRFEKIFTPQLLAQIFEGMKANFEAISDQIKSLPSDINEPQFRNNEFTKDQAESSFDTLNYRYRFDEFQGRQDDVDFLRSFLNHDKPFQWQLIYGDGGMGKSRLALELLKLNEDLWRGGFVLSEWFIKQNPSLWKPQSNMILIIDYAATQAQKVGELIVALYAASEKYRFKVRLLLLERSASGDWLDQLNKPGIEVRTTRFANPHELIAIDMKHLVGLVRQRLEEKGINPPDDIAIKAKIKEIDPKCRPLFAVMIAQALVDGRVFAKLDRKTVIDKIIDRELRKYWLINGETKETKAYICHANLMCLSTLCFGISLEKIVALDDVEIKNLGLPVLEELSDYSFEAARMQRMSGYDEDNEIISPLEPDLLGELFALERLSVLRGKRPQAMIDTAWRLDPKAMGRFMIRAARDYPDLMIDLKALQPSPNNLELSRYFAIWSIGVIQPDMPSLELSRRVSQSTFALHTAFSEDAAVREGAAKGAINLINVEVKAGHHDEARVLFAWLKAFQEANDKDRAVREEAAKGAFNLITAKGNAGYLDEALALFDWLKVLPTADDKDTVVLDQVIRATVNLIVFAAKAENLVLSKKLYEHLLTLDRDFLDELFMRLYQKTFSQFEVSTRSLGWI